MEEKQKEGVVAEGQEPVDQSRDLEEQDGSVSYSDLAEDPKLSSSPDFEEDQVNEPLESSHTIEYTIESELSRNSRDEDSPLPEPRWLEGDESVALWVKVVCAILQLSFNMWFPPFLQAK